MARRPSACDPLFGGDADPRTEATAEAVRAAFAEALPFDRYPLGAGPDAAHGLYLFAAATALGCAWVGWGLWRRRDGGP